MNSLPTRIQFASDLTYIDDTKQMFYRMTLSEFYKIISKSEFKLYEFNRTKSEAHIDDIYTQIVKCYNKKAPIDFYNNFKMCNIKNTNSLCLIDGQHRYYALKRFIEEIKPKFDIEPRFNVDIYIVNDDFETEKIFSIINNTLPITQDDINNEKLIKIIYALRKKYPECIKDADTKRPRVRETDLLTHMKDKRIMNVLPDGNYIEKVLSCIYEINEKLAKNELSYFGTEKNMNVMFESAKNLNFFLALDKTYKWIDVLFQELRSISTDDKDKSKKYILSPFLIKYLKLSDEYLFGVDKTMFKILEQKFLKKNKKKDNVESIANKFNFKNSEFDTIDSITTKIWKANTTKNKTKTTK